MYVNIARTTEELIFKMMMLEICNRVGHVRLTRKERLFKNHLIPTSDTRNTFHMIRQRPDIKLWAKRGLPQFRMCQPQIVFLLNNMVGKLIRKAEAKTKWRAVRPNHINASKLWLFTTILSKSGRDKLFACCDKGGTITFIKPFRLHPDLAGLWLAAFHPH